RGSLALRLRRGRRRDRNARFTVEVRARLFDDLTLVRGDRPFPRFGKFHGGARARLERAVHVVALDFTRARDDARILDHGAELAHVARPTVGTERVERLRCERDATDLMSLGELGQEVLAELGYVADALVQRRRADRVTGEAKEQIRSH